MQGNYTLNVVQFGRETTPGTAVAATGIWRGLFAFPDDARTRTQAEEEVGLLVPAERSFDTDIMATLPMPATPVTYEQLPHIFEAGIKAATPTGVGPYVYTYDFALGDTVNTIKTYTLRGGNKIVTADSRVVPYCFVTEFELSGKSKEAWQIGATWAGQRLTSGALTGALTIPSVTEAIFPNTLFYLDESGGTIGTTQKSGVLRAFSMRVQTGIKPVVSGDGTLYYVSHWHDRPAITFSITYALEQVSAASLVAAERAKFESNSIRLFRLKTPGASSRDFVIDFAGKYDKINSYEKFDDGSTVVRFDGHVVYSATDALYCQYEVTNNLASL